MKAVFDHEEGMEELDAGDVRLGEVEAISDSLRGFYMTFNDDEFVYTGHRFENRDGQVVVKFCFGD